MDSINITCHEGSVITESLTNYKRWFNGMKTFSSVKVESVKNLKELVIRVADVSRVKDKISI